MSAQEKRDKVFINIINKLFEISGHNVTFDDVKDRKDDWYNQYTMTNAQYDEWYKWGVNHINKILKFNKVFAEREMSMIGLNYGLKFSDTIL